MGRRMFSPQIVDSDVFLDMSATAQLLYFHLGMRADDDGFVGNPKKVLRMVGGNDDDLKLLILKRFILIFKSGVIVIKHWRIHNLIRKDRYRKTAYIEEKKQLKVKPNGAYTERQPNGNQRLPQVKLSQVKLSQVNTNPKGLGETPKSYGRKDINLLLEDLKKGLGILDGTKQEQRNFAKLFLDSKIPELYRAMNKASWTPEELRLGVLKIAQLAKEDSFHQKNANSLKYLYKHAGAIINTSQGNKKPIKSFNSK